MRLTQKIFLTIIISIAAIMNLCAVEVKITFPPEGSTLFAGPQTFVAGSIKPPGNNLKINGRTITPYRTGSFLFMHTLTEGKNILKIKSGNYESQHSFIFRKPSVKTTTPKITPLFPAEPSGIITGKSFRISCKAPAGSNSRVQIGERTVALRPDKNNPGTWFTPMKFYCPLNNLPVTFFADGLPDVNAGTLSALAAPSTFKVIGELFSTRARSEPDAGETVAFLSPGDIISSPGFSGRYRTFVLKGKECYVNSKYLKQVQLPPGIKPNPIPIDITNGFGPHPPKGKKPGEILIVLDAGHGGEDSGAVGPSGLQEKTVTLKQTELLDQVLKKAGYKTVLTRSTDKYVSLYDRVREGYNKKADAFISIHYNSTPSQQNPRDKRHISIYAWNSIGEELAKPVFAELKKVSPARGAGVLHGNLAVCRNPAVPSILIELDFITTPEGEELIQTADFQKKAADAILRGVQQWHRK